MENSTGALKKDSHASLNSFSLCGGFTSLAKQGHVLSVSHDILVNKREK